MHLNHATHSDQIDLADVFCTFTTCIEFVKLSVEYLDYVYILSHLDENKIDLSNEILPREILPSRKGISFCHSLQANCLNNCADTNTFFMPLSGGRKRCFSRALV